MSIEEIEKVAIKEGIQEEKLVLKNSDLENLVGSKGLANMRQSKDLPVVFSFKLADMLGKLQPTIKAYMDQKQKLIEKYGDKDENGKLVEQSPNVFTFSTKAKWFQKDFTELLAAETTIDCEKLELLIKDIPVKRTITCPHCKKELDGPGGIISPDDISILKCIIEFKEV